MTTLQEALNPLIRLDSYYIKASSMLSSTTGCVRKSLAAAGLISLSLRDHILARARKQRFLLERALGAPVETKRCLPVIGKARSQKIQEKTLQAPHRETKAGWFDCDYFELRSNVQKPPTASFE